LQGRIVYPRTPIPDPRGKNPKSGRPFVVITSNEELAGGCDPIQAVGITSELSGSPRDHYVLLPFGAHAKTRLSVESAALCTWVIEIARAKVDVSEGFVGPAYIQQIVDVLTQI
jgi:hypothetical protein